MRRMLSVVAEAASNGTPDYELGGSVNHIGKLKYKKSVGKLDLGQGQQWLALGGTESV